MGGLAAQGGVRGGDKSKPGSLQRVALDVQITAQPVSLAAGYLLYNWESELRALAGIGTKESFYQIGCRNDDSIRVLLREVSRNYDSNLDAATLAWDWSRKNKRKSWILAIISAGIAPAKSSSDSTLRKRFRYNRGCKPSPTLQSECSSLCLGRPPNLEITPYMDVVLLDRLVASIQQRRLVFVCGAGLSMGAPSKVPSAASLTQQIIDEYTLRALPPLPAAARLNLETLSEYLFGNGNQSLFVRDLVRWETIPTASQHWSSCCGRFPNLAGRSVRRHDKF